MPAKYLIRVNFAKVDMGDWELQLNQYRVLLQGLNFKINNMFIQATVRDGGTLIAFNRGIDKNMYKIPVKRLEDGYVKEYFNSKSVALLKAIETNTIPEPCNLKENWGYNKCKKYCPVAEFCDVGQYQKTRT